VITHISSLGASTYGLGFWTPRSSRGVTGNGSRYWREIGRGIGGEWVAVLAGNRSRYWRGMGRGIGGK